MAKKLSDAERVAAADVIAKGAALFSTVLKLAFEKTTEAEAKPLIVSQSGELVDAVETFANTD